MRSAMCCLTSSNVFARSKSSFGDSTGEQDLCIAALSRASCCKETQAKKAWVSGRFVQVIQLALLISICGLLLCKALLDGLLELLEGLSIRSKLRLKLTG